MRWRDRWLEAIYKASWEPRLCECCKMQYAPVIRYFNAPRDQFVSPEFVQTLRDIGATPELIAEAETLVRPSGLREPKRAAEESQDSTDLYPPDIREAIENTVYPQTDEKDIQDIDLLPEDHE